MSLLIGTKHDGQAAAESPGSGSPTGSASRDREAVRCWRCGFPCWETHRDLAPGGPSVTEQECSNRETCGVTFRLLHGEYQERERGGDWVTKPHPGMAR